MAGMFAELLLPLQRTQQGIMLPNSAFYNYSGKTICNKSKKCQGRMDRHKKGFCFA